MITTSEYPLITDNDNDNDNNSLLQSNDDDSSSSLPFVHIEVIEELEPESENESIVVDVDTTPVASTSTMLDVIEDESNDRYAYVVIPVVEWNNRLQDMDCTKDKLKIKRYKGSMIPGHGPKASPNYCYHLTSIGIDYIKKFKKEKDMGRGWNKVPKNQTDVKRKIVDKLLVMRKLSDSSRKYEPDQNKILDML